MSSRYAEGQHRGCDFWVPRLRLRVPWEDREAWLRDEQALEAARKASEGEQMVFDLVREWCGPSAVERFNRLARLSAEARRFKQLVVRAAQALEEAGRPEIAAELREEVETEVTAWARSAGASRR